MTNETYNNWAGFLSFHSMADVDIFGFYLNIQRIGDFEYCTFIFTNTFRNTNNLGYPRCNIIYLFSLFYRLLLGLGLLLRMFCFLSFTSAVRNKLYYTGDEPTISSEFFLEYCSKSSKPSYSSSISSLREIFRLAASSSILSSLLVVCTSL